VSYVTQYDTADTSGNWAPAYTFESQHDAQDDVDYWEHPRVRHDWPEPEDVAVPASVLVGPWLAPRRVAYGTRHRSRQVRLYLARAA